MRVAVTGELVVPVSEYIIVAVGIVKSPVQVCTIPVEYGVEIPDAYTLQLKIKEPSTTHDDKSVIKVLDPLQSSVHVYVFISVLQDKISRLTISHTPRVPLKVKVTG